MKYYHFDPEAIHAGVRTDQVPIVEVDPHHLDLKKPTLFILPGLDVLALDKLPPSTLPKDNPKKGPISHLRSLLQRGASYVGTLRSGSPDDPDAPSHHDTRHVAPHADPKTDYKQKLAAIAANEKAFDVIVVAWDTFEENEAHVRAIEKDPGGYYSPAAADFVNMLFNGHNNPDKTTLLGWSYGASFAQECANYFYYTYNAVPRIHGSFVACMTHPEAVSHHGFPGFYSYGVNDTVCAQYAPDLWKIIKPQGTGEFAKLSFPEQIRQRARSVLNVHFDKLPARDDQVLLFSHIPPGGIRKREKMETLNQRPEKPSLDDYIIKPFEDKTCHAPALYMELWGGMLPKDDYSPRAKALADTEKASLPSTIFRRTLANIIEREKPITAQTMLYDKPKREYVIEDEPVDAVSFAIANKLERPIPHLHFYAHDAFKRHRGESPP